MLAVFCLLFEFIILYFIRLNGIESISDPVASAFIILFSLFFFFYVNNNPRLGKNRKALLAGYILRVALLYFDLFGRGLFVLPNSAGDSEMFYANAVAVSRMGTTNRGLFPQALGVLFRFIGTNRLFGQFVNMLCSIVALVFFLYALNELGVTEKAKSRAYRIVCLLPNFAVLSSLLLREAEVCMFITMSAYAFVKWIRSRDEKSFWLASALVLPAAIFHSGSIALAAGYLTVRLIYDKKTQRLSFKLGNVLASGIIVILFAFVLTNYSERFLGKMLSVDDISDVAKTSSAGESSYAQYVGNSNNPVNMLIYTVPRMVFFLFSPFPIFWRGLNDVIAFTFSACYYIACLYLAFKHIIRRRSLNRTMLIMLTTLSLITVFVFAWGTSNGGTALRHRDKLVPLFGLILALAIDKGEPRRYARMLPRD